MRPLSRGALALLVAVLAAVPASLAGSFARPAAVEAARPSLWGDIAQDPEFRAAVGATVRAPAAAGRTLGDAIGTVGEMMLTDVRRFGRFLRTRLTFDTRLEENPFFVAHKTAALVAERVDERWDLAWAVPEELRTAGAWRAAVANLPPASVRGTRATPEHGVSFLGWPPKAE
ncbi:MAG: hypothetical protein HY553_14220 [Elusimicrobia bacterium]|nr:hypothetical protein [Elusimicrobiota bacterium]